MDILELVSSSLASLNIPIVYGWFDKNIKTTHCTFLIFDENDEDYSDDEATTTEHWIQVDIWTKDTEEAQALKKTVKQLLKVNGLLYQDGQDKTEIQNDGSCLWHIASRWLIVEDLE